MDKTALFYRLDLEVLVSSEKAELIKNPYLYSASRFPLSQFFSV